MFYSWFSCLLLLIGPAYFGITFTEQDNIISLQTISGVFIINLKCLLYKEEPQNLSWDFHVIDFYCPYEEGDEGDHKESDSAESIRVQPVPVRV